MRLKWPNDVLWRGEKLAGMLIEMQGDALGPSAAVIGIGLNIRLSDAVRGAIDQPAVDLETACGRAIDRNEVLGLVLDELAHVLDEFSVDGFAPLREEWERYHAHQDQMIDVTLAGGRSAESLAAPPKTARCFSKRRRACGDCTAARSACAQCHDPRRGTSRSRRRGDPRESAGHRCRQYAHQMGPQ